MISLIVGFRNFWFHKKIISYLNLDQEETKNYKNMLNVKIFYGELLFIDF